MISDYTEVIPIIHYPYKILFVDDNLETLKSYEEIIGQNFKITIITSPEKAINFLEENKILESKLFKDVSNDMVEINPFNHRTEMAVFSFNINELLNFADDKQKYNSYGIIVTDYKMPHINGIQLCEKVQNLPIQKILLTGEYDASHAIKALNSNIIDCYIEKGTNNTFADIHYYLKELIKKYFVELTRTFLKTVNQKNFEFLFDQIFIKLFLDILNRFKIKEFYLLNNNGSFLLKNDDSQFVFLVHSNESLDCFSASYKDEVEIQSLLDAVENRELMPFFGINSEMCMPPLYTWSRFFYKVNKYETYYWNIIPLKEHI